MRNPKVSFFVFFENIQFFGLKSEVFDFVVSRVRFRSDFIGNIPQLWVPKKTHPGVFLKVSTLPCGECAPGLGGRSG